MCIKLVPSKMGEEQNAQAIAEVDRAVVEEGVVESDCGRQGGRA